MTPLRWIKGWYQTKLMGWKWRMQREASQAAVTNLLDDLVMYMETKNLYDQGWNDAMKSVARTLKNYQRCGVVK